MRKTKPPSLFESLCTVVRLFKHMQSPISIISAATLATLAAIYAFVAMRDDWYTQEPYREMQRERREERNAWSLVYAAADRLESNGARYPDAGKGPEFSAIDFSEWKGTDSDFDDLIVLSKIAHLNCYPHMQSTLAIRLGRNTGSSIIPKLLKTKNIEFLDVEDANLSNEDLERIRQELPNCRIGPLDFDW